MTVLRAAGSGPAAPVPIECHSLLSDQRTAALVDPQGRVVWLCAPRIDSPPVFAELLGGPEAGFFAVRPAEPAGEPVQRHLGHSMVLETSWGALRVTDYLDCSEGPAGRIRLVRVLSGTGRAVVECAPRLERAAPSQRSATAKWCWAQRLTVPARQTDLVRGSALVLKALCHGPTGAIVAAPTTSLPECLGGTRNWDYRYCWIRDASMTAASLVRLGSTGEATDLLDWLLGLIDDGVQPDRLAPVYTVDGGALPPETEEVELEGYGGSRPVRIGNAADRQVQTDVFGPVMELLWRLTGSGASLSERHWRLVEQLVSAVERRWQDPDQGIWELRAPPRHHVHSRTMCWMAVDRAIAIAGTLFGVAVPAWERLRDAIAADVLQHGWNPTVGAFTAAYGSADLDAAVLMIGLSGLVRPNDPRLAATVAAIETALRRGTGVYRYSSPDGLPGREGAFNLLTSWLIDAKILIGDLNGAEALFEGYVALAGPTGLLAEQHDPATGLALGNFPQAYSHAGLIENALNLAEAISPPA